MAEKLALEIKKARFNPFFLPSDFFKVVWGPCLDLDSLRNSCDVYNHILQIDYSVKHYLDTTRSNIL